MPLPCRSQNTSCFTDMISESLYDINWDRFSLWQKNKFTCHYNKLPWLPQCHSQILVEDETFSLTSFWLHRKIVRISKRVHSMPSISYSSQTHHLVLEQGLSGYLVNWCYSKVFQEIVIIIKLLLLNFSIMLQLKALPKTRLGEIAGNPFC